MIELIVRCECGQRSRIAGSRFLSKARCKICRRELEPNLFKRAFFAFCGFTIGLASALSDREKPRRAIPCARSGKPIDDLSGEEFEGLLAYLFRARGYEVELTPRSGDQGADLLVSKSGIRTAVQAKRWRGTVGNSAVQEVYAARAYYSCDRALVVATSLFSASATELAEKTGVEIWDRKRLFRELEIRG